MDCTDVEEGVYALDRQEGVQKLQSSDCTHTEEDEMPWVGRRGCRSCRALIAHMLKRMSALGRQERVQKLHSSDCTHAVEDECLG